MSTPTPWEHWNVVAWVDANSNDTIDYGETVRSVSVWVPVHLDSLTVTANLPPVELRPLTVPGLDHTN